MSSLDDDQGIMHDIPSTFTSAARSPHQTHTIVSELPLSNLDLCRPERQRMRVKSGTSKQVSNEQVYGSKHYKAGACTQSHRIRYKGTGSSKLGCYDKQWIDRYLALKEYKEKFGDCLVSQTGKYPVLGRWVNKQREFYKLYRSGKRTTLNEKRIKLLGDLGFVWDAADRQKRIFKRNDEKWMRYFNYLKQYIEKNGSFPRRKFKVGDLNLGEWVHKQKQQYALMKKGKYSTISQDRIDKLNEVNFPWPPVHVNPTPKKLSLSDNVVFPGNQDDAIEIGSSETVHIDESSENGSLRYVNPLQKSEGFNVDVDNYFRSIMPKQVEESDNHMVSVVRANDAEDITDSIPMLHNVCEAV